MTWQALAGVAVAGAVGAVSRYALHLAVTSLWGERFPVATLLVNVLGCLVLGFVVELAWRSPAAGAWLRLWLPVGLLGGFTTFSTFSYETLRHAQDGHWGVVFLNVAAHVGLGLLAVAWGALFARTLTTG